MKITIGMAKHSFIIGMLIILAFSCNNKSPLIPFYQQLENRIEDKEVLKKIKKLPQDSLYAQYQFFKEEYREVYGISNNKIRINAYLDSENIDTSVNYRWNIILLGFRKYLNKQTINIEQIIFEYIELSRQAKVRHDEQQKLYDKEYYQIVQKANKKWMLGDTISVILPVKFDTDSSRYTYYKNGYPYSLDYSFSDDSFEMRGILLNKFYDDGTINMDVNNIDSVNLVFKLKVIELSDTITKVDWKKLKIGDEFDLWLKLYGRPIPPDGRSMSTKK